jgi:hypothetical protein
MTDKSMMTSCCLYAEQIGALQQYHRALLPLLLGTAYTRGGQADGAQPQNAGAAAEAGSASDDDSSSDEDSAELLVHDVDGLEVRCSRVAACPRLGLGILLVANAVRCCVASADSSPAHVKKSKVVHPAGCCGSHSC